MGHWSALVTKTLPGRLLGLGPNQCGSAYDQPLCGVPSRHTYLGLPTEPSHIWEHCVQIIYFSQRKNIWWKQHKFPKDQLFLAAFVYELNSLFQHISSQKHPTAYHRREVNQRRSLKREGGKGALLKVGSSFISCCCCWPGTGNQARNNSVQASQQNFVEIPITWYGWFITMSCYWFADNLTFSILGWHSIFWKETLVNWGWRQVDDHRSKDKQQI